MKSRLVKALKRRIAYPTLSKWHPSVEVKTDSARLKVDLRDHVIARFLYLDGVYEPEFQQLFRLMGLDGAVCVDIGANLGLHTVELGARAGARGRVYAFEPSRHNFGLLQENIALNGLNNVTAVHAALSDREGTARLRLSATNFGDHQVATAGTGGAYEEIKLTTGDAALAGESEGRVKLIKIDVQGHEYQVMQGLTKTLARNRDVFVMMEVAPGPLKNAGSSGEQLMRWMSDQGFHGWEFHPHRILPVSSPWAYDLIDVTKDVNVLFCRDREKLLRLLETWRGCQIPRSG
ncbi:MAG TPA: FkbM family methyltransferase [Bdellovibrionales bacterium]|nr:FkbM family methyltransferase [Bdellovibrionales bacterium]